MNPPREQVPEDGSLRPKKSLGQNFLTSQAALERMCAAAGVGEGDLVLEIGPGKGALTKKLLEKGADVVAIEKDRRMIGELETGFAEEAREGRLRITEGDVLETDIGAFVGEKPYKLVANIPYYITGAILRKFLEDDRRPALMALLVQKEVAARIVARDGKESILSISVKAYGTPASKGTVKAGSFFPKPSVDSAILLVSGISGDFFKDLPEEGFFELVRAAFARKRRQLSGALSERYGKERAAAALEASGVSPAARAEDLALDDWARLARELR